MQGLHLDDILSRVAALTGAKTDAALAAEVGVSPQTLANWRRRKSIPIEELYVLAEHRSVSLDYLLLGKSPNDIPVNMPVCQEIRKALTTKYGPGTGGAIDLFAYHMV